MQGYGIFIHIDFNFGISILILSLRENIMNLVRASVGGKLKKSGGGELSVASVAVKSV